MSEGNDAVSPEPAEKYPHAIRFTSAQRAELRRLGVPEKAISVIEVEALPRAKRLLQAPVPMADVRAELTRVEAAILAARDAIEGLLSWSDNMPIRQAARAKIRGGGLRHQTDGIPLNRASEALIPAAEVVADAIRRLPTKPVRHQVASDYPVEMIHDALQKGCLAARMPFERLGGRRAGVMVVAPALRPSASPTSPFRRIVGICYERLGMATTDPERAIKGYAVRWARDADDIARQLNGTEPPSEI